MIAHTSQTDENWSNYTEYAENLESDVCTEMQDAYFAYDALQNDRCENPREKVAMFFSNATQKQQQQDLKNVVLLDFEKILEENYIWRKIFTGPGPKPVEWRQSALQHFPSSYLQLDRQGNTINKGKKESDLEDDSVLRKQLDMHSLVLVVEGKCSTSQGATGYTSLENDDDNSVQTADEVIEEIESILMNADEQDAAFDDELEQQTGIVIAQSDEEPGKSSAENESCWNVSPIYNQNNDKKIKSLKRMPVAELNEELSDLESTVKYLSECLLKELNIRDELLYEKEIKSLFISKILEVQYKQEQFQQNNRVYNSRSKFGKLTKSLSMSNASVSSTPGRFLTTVIPFDDGGVPTMEGLQALIKLLDAIKEDSSEVPSLITKYILKVLCPAPTAMNTLNL